MCLHAFRRNKVAGAFIAATLLLSSAQADYELADLNGIWSIHGVVGGADPNVPGSFYMTGTVDTTGGTTVTDYGDSQGISAMSWADNTVDLALSGGGIVTLSGDDAPFRGVMNWEDEDFVVSVGTVAPGPDTGVGGDGLWAWVKQSATPTFSQSDGAGTWWLHGLYFSDDSWGSWSRGQLQVDTIGNVSFVPGTFANSDGDANTPPDGTTTISSYGYVGFSYDPNMHGIMNLDKDLIVFSMPETDGGSLNIMQKHSPSVTFSTADMVGNWHMYELGAELEMGTATWGYGMMEIDSDGSLQGVELNSFGETDTFSVTFSIDNDGVITLAEDSDTHGTMSDDKDMIVIVSGDGSDWASLIVLVRAVASPLYRFWSPGNLRHFYTISLAERLHVEATWPDVWTYEGEVSYAFPQNIEEGLVPVYRFWSPTMLAHFYTISESEKTDIETNWPDAWTYEGTVFYAFPSALENSIPVYRFWSPTFLTHFYTISESEKNNVEATWPDDWTYEQIAWYAYE